jgi:type IV pilus assembly protein PilM
MLTGSLLGPQAVGLDIGSSAVRAVALRPTRKGWALIAAAEAPMPSGSLLDGNAVDPAAASGAVRRALSRAAIRQPRVIAAVSGRAAIVKRLLLPRMSAGDLSEAIRWETEQHVPFDPLETRLDYHVSADAGSTDVLLVAARKDRLNNRASVVTRAGYRIVVLDLEALALTNACHMNYPEWSDQQVGLVHVGRAATLVCLVDRGHLMFTRDIPLGGKLYVEALQHELGLDAATAACIQQGGQPPEDVRREHAIGVMRDASRQLVFEVRATVDAYRAAAPAGRLHRIALSGGGSSAVGLFELLTAEFGIPVDVLDPFRRVNRPKAAKGEPAGPAYAIAVGLAMRRKGDR